MATDIKQAFRDIALYGTILGGLLAILAYTWVLPHFEREIVPKTQGTCYCQYDLSDFEYNLNNGLTLTGWGNVIYER